MIVHEPITRCSISALGEITYRHSYLRENMLVTHVFAPSEFNIVSIELDRVRVRKPNLTIDSCPFCLKALDKNYCKNPKCKQRIKEQLDLFLISVGAPLLPGDRSHFIDSYMSLTDPEMSRYLYRLIKTSPDEHPQLSFFFKHLRYLSAIKNTQTQYDFIMNRLLHKDESLTDFPHLSALVTRFLKIV